MALKNYRFNQFDKSLISIRVCRLASELVKVNERALFFTINQDLFVERFFRHSRIRDLYYVIPGINDNQKWFLENAFLIDLRKEDYVKLPTKDDLEAVKDGILSGNKVFYVKLHGSQSWLNSDGEQQMVIGWGKAEQIQNEPLLAWYF